MRIVCTVAMVCTCTAVFAEKMNFDRDWEFALKDFSMTYGKVGLCSPSPSSNDNGQPRVAADTNGWRKVDLPHDWALALPVAEKGSRYGFRAVGPGFPANSVGWYRKHFEVSKSLDGQRVFLQFDGVYRDSQYWVNGVYLGRNDSGYIGRRFDVTDLLRYGATNNLVTVRVDASIDEGWWYAGAGIYRHAWMITEPEDGLVPDSTFIYLKELRSDAAVMHVDYETFAGGKAGYDFTVEQPHLWSPDDPYLYTLELKGEKFTYGIRTVKFDAQKGLLINGKRVQVNGVCIHHDHAGVGVAVPDALQDYRVKRLKSMGVNGIRTSHNPPSPELLDACDRLGVVVMDEQRFFSSSDEGLDRLARLIRRDRNHPSVIAWSFGNEEHNVQGTDTGRRMAESMKRLQRRLDPTRVCTYGGNNGQTHEGVNSVVDVRGVNYVRLMGEGSAKKMCAGTDDYHAAHPEVPMWGSEEASTLVTRGGEEVQGGVRVMPDTDTPTNRPYCWALTAEEWTSFYAERPYLAGAFAWTGFDYRGECRWPATHCNFGILDLCGFDKNNASYYRARWTNQDVLHVYPHWNLPRTNLWVNTNCDTVELFVNGRSVGRQTRDPKCFRMNFPVTYAPGVVEAKGMRNGRPVAFRMETTGAAVQLRLEPDRTVLAADGADATVVNVTALDAEGREVPNACLPVSFVSEGAGEILGLGNGDPMSHEYDVRTPDGWRRNLFNGKCQVVVRAGRAAGTLKLQARLSTQAVATTEIKVGVEPLQDRWFYVARSLAKPEHVQEITDIVKTARSVDLNGMLFACGAEGIGSWDTARRARLTTVKKVCDEAGIEIIPIIWSVGYGGGNNAWCAADACTNVPFVARGKRAVFAKGSAPTIANGGFEESAAKRMPGWKFIDQLGEISFVDTAVKASGAASLRMENFTANKHGHGRACAALTVVPGRRYRVRAKMKTENLAPLDGLRLQVYAVNGPNIAARSARMAATQDWTELACEFDSGARTEYYVYLGIWGGKAGRFWIDDVSVEELGCPPPVVREGLPFVVRDAKTGRVYREGIDYVAPVDTHKTNGQYFELVAGGAIADGTRLAVDYWTAVVVADRQRPCCMSAPALYAHYRTSAAAIKDALNPRKWFLSMDEIRGGGTCPLCRARNVDMAHQLADCLARQREIIRAVRPDAEIYVWSDMLDPAHNAHDNYYACRGTFAGVWDLIPKDLIISCWYGEKRDISMPFFSAKGFRTQAAAYYDTDDLGNCPGWLETCRRTPGCTGIMYTTWRNQYKLLAPFGELLKNAR